MADRSRLIPTPITDRTGKRTTVYRKPTAAAPAMASLPAPSRPPAVRPDPLAAREQRLARIAERNALWRESRWRGAEDRNALLGPGAEAAGLAATADAEALLAEVRGTDSWAMSNRLAKASGDQEFARIAIAVKHRHECADAYIDPSIAPADLGRVRDLARVPYWAADGFSIAMDTAEALQRLDLMYHDRLPEPEDEWRFIAHLRAATLAVSYLDSGKRENDDCIRLIDERPDQVLEIARQWKGGMHVAGIRGYLDGEVAKPLVLGVL